MPAIMQAEAMALQSCKKLAGGKKITKQVNSIMASQWTVEQV